MVIVFVAFGVAFAALVVEVVAVVLGAGAVSFCA